MKELQHNEAQLFFEGKSVAAVDTSGPNTLSGWCTVTPYLADLLQYRALRLGQGRRESIQIQATASTTCQFRVSTAGHRASPGDGVGTTRAWGWCRGEALGRGCITRVALARVLHATKRVVAAAAGVETILDSHCTVAARDGQTSGQHSRRDIVDDAVRKVPLLVLLHREEVRRPSLIFVHIEPVRSTAIL